MKLKTILGVVVASVATMILSVATQAASTVYFGQPESTSGAVLTDTDVPDYYYLPIILKTTSYDNATNYKISITTKDANKTVPFKGVAPINMCVYESSTPFGTTTSKDGIISWNGNNDEDGEYCIGWASQELALGATQPLTKDENGIATLVLCKAPMYNPGKVTVAEIKELVGINPINVSFKNEAGRANPMNGVSTFVTFNIPMTVGADWDKDYIHSMSVEIDGKVSPVASVNDVDLDKDGTPETYQVVCTLLPKTAQAKVIANVRLLADTATSDTDATVGSKTGIELADFGKVEIEYMSNEIKRNGW